MSCYFELDFSWYFGLPERAGLEVLSLNELIEIDVLVFGAKHNLALLLFSLRLLQLFTLDPLRINVYLVGLVKCLRLLILHLNDLLQIHLVVLSQLPDTPNRRDS